jgi:hypothetical protein
VFRERAVDRMTDCCDCIHGRHEVCPCIWKMIYEGANGLDCPYFQARGTDPPWSEWGVPKTTSTATIEIPLRYD